MHSAELNVPQNHVYLFKPQVRKLRVRRPIVYNIVEVTIDGGKKETYGEQG